MKLKIMRIIEDNVINILIGIILAVSFLFNYYHQSTNEDKDLSEKTKQNTEQIALLWAAHNDNSTRISAEQQNEAVTSVKIDNLTTSINEVKGRTNDIYDIVYNMKGKRH